MLKRVEIPSKPRFTYATKRAYELLAELNICQFPVDPWKIIKQFTNWHLKGWMELREYTGEDDPLNINKEKAEAKTITLRGSDEYLIVYDDRVNNNQRIRWTIAHEIGHIVLGHLVEFNATALNRRGLTKSEYGVLEVEAHCFAAELLAPKTIIRRFDFNDDPQGISLICDISKDAAVKRLDDMKRIDFTYYPTENKILRNFYNHLNNGGFFQAVHDTAYKFYPSSIYSDLCKYARICRNCNNFIKDEKHKFCSVCGKETPLPEQYSPLTLGKKIEGTPFHIGFPIKLKGQYYYEIPFYKDKRVEFCPICKIKVPNDRTQVCANCGTPLVNMCTNESRELEESSRYCPDCGEKTSFKAIYDNLPERLSADTILVPDKYDDYIELEYWPFILMTIYSWEKDKDLYIALEDSIAFYDCEEMIIFVRNEREAEYAKKGKEIILTCLTKYGYLSVENINVMVADLKS